MRFLSFKETRDLVPIRAMGLKALLVRVALQKKIVNQGIFDNRLGHKVTVNNLFIEAVCLG